MDGVFFGFVYLFIFALGVPCSGKGRLWYLL